MEKKKSKKKKELLEIKMIGGLINWKIKVKKKSRIYRKKEQNSKDLVRIHNIWLRGDPQKGWKGKNIKIQGKFNSYF